MSNLEVHAFRSDGLGERLRTILNAMVIAKAIGANFKFSWRSAFRDLSVSSVQSAESDKKNTETFHAIAGAEEIFSETFLSRHLTPAQRWENYVVLDAEATSLQDVAEQARQAGKKILVRTQDISNFKAREIQDFSWQDFSKAFRSIQFSDKMEKARRLAWDFPLKDNVVTLHLRSGDLIYGAYRFFHTHAEKTAPIYVIERILRDHEGGCILFGQDEDLCNYFADKFGVTFAGNISAEAGLDLYQSAIFDITLMSRGERIYCGNSGFAILASLISPSDLISLQSTVGPAKRNTVFLESVALRTDDPRVSDLQKAFSYWYASEKIPSLKPFERMDLLESAISKDPENCLYSLLKAALFLEAGHRDEADKSLDVIVRQITDAAAIESSLPVHVLGAMMPNGTGLRLAKLIDAIETLVDDGYPNAALCVGFASRAAGDAERQRKCIRVLEAVQKPGSLYDRAARIHLRRAV